MMKQTYRSIQSGFTIIELMIAMTVGMLLMAILGGIYFNSVQTAGGLVDRINMNRQAREMFDILAMGGAGTDVNIYEASHTKRDNHNYIFGLRGRVSNNAKSSDVNWRVPENIMSDASINSTPDISYKLGLSLDNESPLENMGNSAHNKPILSSEAGGSAGYAIFCSKDEEPVGGCVKDEQRSLRGFLRSGVVLLSGGNPIIESDANTLRIPLMLINPNAYYLSESIGRVGITDDQIYDTYWTAFRPLVEYHP